MTDFRLSLTNSASGNAYFFSGVEIPEKISFGGSQKLAVHELLGNGRVVDALGAQPQDMEWSGLLLGPSASTRAQDLKMLADSGASCVLDWGYRRYRVVVSAFSGDFLRYYRIPYTLKLTVCADLTQPPDFIDDTATLEDQALADAVDAGQLASAVLASAPPDLVAPAWARPSRVIARRAGRRVRRACWRR